jgi:pseudaminic acid biosynthesis-associated methylase
MNRPRTKQEEFWEGAFGDAYTERNVGEHLIASNLALLSKVFSGTSKVTSVLEFGANIGLNLEAIRLLLPTASITAVEINAKAVAELRKKQWLEVQCTSIAEYRGEATHDFVLSKGVLIHINPEQLPVVYDTMYRAAARYICVAEYYNPAPVSVNYRGNADCLFKRDFAGELLERFTDLRLVDYGFVYRRDPCFPQDDVTWFLLQKSR